MHLSRETPTLALKAVLFDHDGTLVDSEHVHFLHWRRILARYNVAFTEADYRQHYAGIPTPQNALRLAEIHRLDVTPHALTVQKEVLTAEYLEQTAMPLMPFAKRVVASFLRYKLALGVVTGAGKSGVNSTLQFHDLAGSFSAIATGDDVTHSKPSPDVYLYALQQLGIAAKQCIAVEDTSTGVQAAVAAGITCCAVPNQYSRDHDFSKASHVFDSLDEFSQWVVVQIQANTFRINQS